MFFIFLFLFLMIWSIPNGVEAHSWSGVSAEPNFGLCMAIIVVFMGIFIASFSIYIRYCSRPSSINGGILSAVQAKAAFGGLDQLTIDKFPTFTYAEVKDIKIKHEDLECAFCLNEFGDTDILRLIPKCNHVFHMECVDPWLEVNATCPYCRAILDTDSAAEEGLTEAENQESNGETDDMVVQVVCENPPPVQEPIRPRSGQIRMPRNGSMKRIKGVNGLGRFRSNSTGHSDVNEERITLILPEENKKEMIDRALLKRAKSFTAKGLKASSSRGGRSYRRMGSLDLPRASPFVLRTQSIRTRDNTGEGSSKGLRPTAIIPSIKCLELKPTNEIGHVMVNPV